jgi:hypothetical protein
VLDVRDEATLRAACAGILARLAPGAMTVEHMAPLADGVEVILGCRQDPRFGPVLLLGLGGLYTEILKDTTVALAPVEADEAEWMLASLRGAALLRGARGRPPLAAAAAARVAATLSRFAAAHPEVAEVEVNPVLVTPTTAVALDARIVLAVAADAS